MAVYLKEIKPNVKTNILRPSSFWHFIFHLVKADTQYLEGTWAEIMSWRLSSELLKGELEGQGKHKSLCLPFSIASEVSYDW